MVRPTYFIADVAKRKKILAEKAAFLNGHVLGELAPKWQREYLRAADFFYESMRQRIWRDL